MRRNQSSRLKDLASKIGWNGDLNVLAEYLAKVVPCMPESVGDAMKQYYIDSIDVPRRGDGKFYTYFYQTLQAGRAALEAVANTSPELAELANKYREEGMWDAA